MDGETIIHEWFEKVWNQGDEATIDRLMPETTKFHGMPEVGSITGPAEFKKFWNTYRGAFPDCRIEVLETIREGNRIAARCRLKGVHGGDHLGIKATNKGVDIEGMVLAHIEDGKFKEGWNFFDLLTMNKQMGLM